MNNEKSPLGFFQDNLFNKLIVDNFAGGGGASTGIELATGRPVDIAINHDEEAIAMHRQNHPYTQHYCESVWDVDPVKVTAGRTVGIAWFSPDCKHFSKAKGGKPVDKHIRGLAWIVLRWAAKVRPEVIFLENVEEFLTWGRVRKGKPVEKDKGNTFKKWCGQLVALGYTIDWRVLKACDYGVPTSRKRLYLVARCDGKQIVFPEPTHGKGKKPYRAAADIIDWSIPCPSIFEREKPLVPATLRRIAKGLDRFVIKAKKPFIIDDTAFTVMQYHSERGENETRSQGLKNPLNTVDGSNRYGLVGAALSPFIEQANFENVPLDSREPLSTVTGINKHRMVAPKIQPFVVQNFGGNYNGVGSSIETPLPTVTAKDHNSIGCAFISKFNQYSMGQDPKEPLDTVMAGATRFSACTAFISKYYGGTYRGAGSDATAPLDTITAEERHAIVAPFLSSFYKGGGSAQADSVDKPLHTILAKEKHAVVTVKLTAADREANNLGHWEQVRQILNDYAGYDLKDDEILLFKVNGEVVFISDIGMRMLLPKELYAAQGFPSDYKFEFDWNGKPYSKKAQVARCGNSVCPQMAEMLVRANVTDMAYKKPIRTMRELEKAIAV